MSHPLMVIPREGMVKLFETAVDKPACYPYPHPACLRCGVIKSDTELTQCLTALNLTARDASWRDIFHFVLLKVLIYLRKAQQTTSRFSDTTKV